MSPFFNPGPIETPDIPIYIAGVNPGLARLAGELCQGFHVHPFHSPRYLKEILLPAIELGADRAGRMRQDLAVSVTAFVAVSPDEREFARTQIAFYASTPSYRPVMALHGWEAEAAKLSAHAARGAWSEMPKLITDEILGEFCVLTDEARLTSELREKYEGIADRITIYSAFVPGNRDGFWRGVTSSFNA